MKTIPAVCVTAVLLAACQTVPQPRVTAELPSSAGSKVFGPALGRALFEPAGNNVHVIVYADGLSPGQLYGLRVHDTGDCGGQGATNLPPLRADYMGRGVVEGDINGVTTDGIVGRSLAMHTAPDSQAAGARIACAAITRR
jgi:Cu/Zn superoxide dismutase